MNKYSVGVVQSVRAVFYYNTMREDGSWDFGTTYTYQGTSSEVSDRYLDDAKSKQSSRKPWSDFWGQQGYCLLDRFIESSPDNYPDTDVYPVVKIGSPVISNRQFLSLQREGAVVANNFKGEKLIVKYIRGIDIKDVSAPPIAVFDSNLSFFKSGDVFQHQGRPVKLVNNPTVQYYYCLTTMTTDIHPFDLGWVRHSTAFTSEIVKNSVVTKALAEAESGSYDLLTEIAELPSTVGFLANIVKRAAKSTETHKRAIASLYRQLKTATGKFAEKIARKIASAWLAYRYAIMPLMYSIEDIKATLKGYKRVFAKFRAKETSDHDDTHEGFDQITYAQIEHFCWIKRAYSPEDLVDQLLGVLKINFFSTAWELVTLSFVVDWFVNIGDVITAFSGNKCFLSQTATASRKISGSSFYSATQNNTVSVEVIPNLYERVLIEPRDYIGLSLQFDMNWKRTLDAIALGLSPSIKLLKRMKN